MTNTQLLLTILIPTITVLVGILLNHSGTGRLEARLTTIEADLRRFYQILGEYGARIDHLERPSRG